MAALKGAGRFAQTVLRRVRSGSDSGGLGRKVKIKKRRSNAELQGLSATLRRRISAEAATETRRPQRESRPDSRSARTALVEMQRMPSAIAQAASR